MCESSGNNVALRHGTRCGLWPGQAPRGESNRHAVIARTARTRRNEGRFCWHTRCSIRRDVYTVGKRSLRSRRILVRVALAAGLACGLGAPVAVADPTPARVTPPNKKRAATASKSKPASAPKKPPKQPPAVATDSTESAKPGAAAGAGHEVVEHESRIEFDERMVRGQTAAGAIFLFQRTPSDLKSIVEIPTSFRERTVELVQPHRATP